MPLLNLRNDRLVFLALRLVNLVVSVHTPDRPVGWDDHHVQLIDIVKFGGLRLRRAGHARQFFIETEIVLNGDRRQRLCLTLDLHTFLGLDRLMQTVAPPPSRQDAAGELVHNIHAVVLYDVIDILLVEAVGTQQLIHIMDTLAAHHEVGLDALAPLRPLFRTQRGIAIQRGEGGDEIGHNEHFGVGGRELLAALIGQRHLARALVNRKQQHFPQVARKLLTHFGEHHGLNLLVQLPYRSVFDQMEKLFVFRHAVIHLIQLVHGRLCIVPVNGLLRLRNQPVTDLHLRMHETLDARFQLHVLRR